jgi:hypothetical protein
VPLLFFLLIAWLALGNRATASYTARDLTELPSQVSARVHELTTRLRGWGADSAQ